MKNTLIRVFVLSLAVTGFGAATVASHARTTTKASLMRPTAPTSIPPLCPPGTGNNCGFE
jgi:hypothetical protein